MMHSNNFAYAEILVSALAFARRPAAAAALTAVTAVKDGRLLGGLLGAAGLASCAAAVVSMVETWRVGPRANVHELRLLGQPFSYPAANAAALVVLATAAVGLAVLVLATRGTARELAAARRAARALRALGARPGGDPRVLVLRERRPLAFCAGLVHPRVYISTGLLERLDELALTAVLAHERHHARRRDPLRLAARRVLAQALFFAPGLSELRHRQDLLSELAADAHAIETTPHGRSALARAMLSMDGGGEGPGAVDPRRADHLLGELAGWSLPMGLVAAAGGAIALFAALGMLAARLARGSTTLALPFLSSRPCVVVLALIPSATAAVLLARRRGR